MFFAVLVAALALAIGAGIYDLVVRQTALAETIADSQAAFYAADTGAECALYWDNKFSVTNGAPSAFATSTSWTGPVPTGVDCNLYDVAQNGTEPNPYDGSAPNKPWLDWSHSPGYARSATAATTTFTVIFTLSPPRCAFVQVAKYIDSGNHPRTTITSDGYNNCDKSSLSTVNRELQVTY